MLKRESESKNEKTSDTRKIKSEIERAICSIEIDKETAEMREESEANACQGPELNERKNGRKTENQDKST